MTVHSEIGYGISGPFALGSGTFQEEHEKTTPEVPAETILVSPNPFNPNTVIQLTGGQKTEDREQNIQVRIYNTKGQMVDLLTSDLCHLTSGLSWNAEGFPSGIYLLKVMLGKKAFSRQITLMK
jgi:hypothetical protein